jgi:hypothetical protein
MGVDNSLMEYPGRNNSLKQSSSTRPESYVSYKERSLVLASNGGLHYTKAGSVIERMELLRVKIIIINLFVKRFVGISY